MKQSRRIDAEHDSESVARREIVRVGVRERARDVDSVVVEAPLELRVSGQPVIVTMRTPGNDDELALGWLLAEGLISAPDDVAELTSGGEGPAATIDVTPAPGKPIDIGGALPSRGAPSTSACGVCGRQTIDDLLARCLRVEDDSRWAVDVLVSLPEALRSRQRIFAVTGGLHAAAAARPDGSLICVREDVGRHNAVDKLVGRLLREERVPASGSALVVSGRASFEIVQKAVMARFAVIVSVSAPSSLAIDIAAKANVTLVGFARDGAFNVYSVPERIGNDTR